MDSKKEVKAMIPELVELLNSDEPSARLAEISKAATSCDAKAKDKAAKVILETTDAVTDSMVWWLYRGVSGGKCQGGSARDPVCAWVYDWTQANTPYTRQFVLQLLPALIWAYYAGASGLVSSSSSAGEGGLAGVEACLLGVHNLAVREVRAGHHHNPFMHPLLRFDSVYCTGLTETLEESPAVAESLGNEDAAYKRRAAQPKRVICDGDRTQVVCSALNMLTKHFSVLTGKTKASVCKIIKEVSCLGYPFDSYSHGGDNNSNDNSNNNNSSGNATLSCDRVYPGLDSSFRDQATKWWSERNGGSRHVLRMQHSERLFSYALSLLRLCISAPELGQLVIRASDAIKAAAVYNNFMMAIITADALIKITETIAGTAAANTANNAASSTTTPTDAALSVGTAEKSVNEDAEDAEKKKKKKKKGKRKSKKKESDDDSNSSSSSNSSDSSSDEDSEKKKKKKKKKDKDNSNEKEAGNNDNEDESEDEEADKKKKKKKSKTKN